MVFDTGDLERWPRLPFGFWWLHSFWLQPLSPWLFLLALFVQFSFFASLLCWFLQHLDLSTILVSAYMVSLRKLIGCFHVHWYADDLQICISSFTSSLHSKVIHSMLTEYFHQHVLAALKFPVSKAELTIHLSTSSTSIPHIAKHTSKCLNQKYLYPTVTFTAAHLINPNFFSILSSYFSWICHPLQAQCHCS